MHHHPLREVGHAWWLIPLTVALITVAGVAGTTVH